MSDPKNSIPSWQRAASYSPSVEDSTKQDPSPTRTSIPPQEPGAEEAVRTDQLDEAALLQQGRSFLQESHIRVAPRERKITFLERKGLKKEQIEQLLGGTDTPQPVKSGLKESGWAAELKATQTVAPAPQPKKDVPPIITYPEFLVQAHKPEPLVTTKRLLNTLYVAGGSAALIYGFSKYIVAPMADTLTAARHELLSHATTQIDALNDKLEGMVSTVPTTGLPRKDIYHDMDDIESLASDPTELFHRDIGIQTSPSLSRRGSLKADSLNSDNNTLSNPIDTVSKHEDRLRIMASHLTELSDSAKNNTSANTEVSEKLTDLRSYLDEMLYASPYYGYGYAGVDGRGVGGTGGSGPGSLSNKDDPIEKVKAEIRSVKGVLLSARNFPSAQHRSVPGR